MLKDSRNQLHSYSFWGQEARLMFCACFVYANSTLVFSLRLIHVTSFEDRTSEYEYAEALE